MTKLAYESVPNHFTALPPSTIAKDHRLLFVSRAYPPTLWGIENQNRGLAEALAHCVPTTLIANRSGKRALPTFLPKTLFRLIKSAGLYDVLLLGDGVLAPLGAITKLLHPSTRVFSIVHGLDITYGSRPGLTSAAYRHLNIPALARLDGVIAVGRATADAAVAAGIPSPRIHFIPNGFNPEEFSNTATRADLSALVGTDLGTRHVIVQVGRYVERKGLKWFIREVLPGLPESVFLVAIGAAPTTNTMGDPGYLGQCEQAARESRQAHRVKLLVNLPQQQLKTCLGAADLVVMPNIPVPGTIEGFGLTVLEAAAMERVVLASRLEGLLDATADGENGVLLPSGNADVWRDSIVDWLSDASRRTAFGKTAAEIVQDRFAWPKIAQRYLELLYPSN
jgi:glycosyltransferase involved in cell wall biosynthesis